MTREQTTVTLATLILTFQFLGHPIPAAAFDQNHALLDRVLRTHVQSARVDYKALKRDSTELDLYLRGTASVTKTEFDGWTEPQQLAFLFNVYNAGTLRLILDHYPVSSIKKIGGLFSGPWDQEVVDLFGGRIDLATVEHRFLRAHYKEPRLHFAIVCAALGCPPLRPEAYVAHKLDLQLQEQGRLFLQDPSKNRVDPPSRTIHLSPIFRWFDDDFEAAAGTVLQFVTDYFPADTQAALRQGRWRIKYTAYDWALNEK